MTWEGKQLGSSGVSSALTKTLVAGVNSSRQCQNNIRKMVVTLVNILSTNAINDSDTFFFVLNNFFLTVYLDHFVFVK